jgi:hypothetical protein
MKNFASAIIVVSFLVCCKGGLGGLFIPNVSNQWVSNRNTTFNFSVAKTGVNESTFVGFENTDLESSDFSGQFSNYDISFKFKSGPETDILYTGNFVKGSNPLKITATGSNGKRLELTQRL